MFNARNKCCTVVAVAAAAMLVESGCRGGDYSPQAAAPRVAFSEFQGRAGLAPDVSILKGLKRQVIIGSTVDPANGAQNPYGLTVAPTSAGKLKAGDLLVCNFNGKSNVQGTGASVIALHPTRGSKPAHLSSIAALKGCDAIAFGSDGLIWVAAMVADDNPVIDASGKLVRNIKGGPFAQPWGQIFAHREKGAPVFYATNAQTGTVVRIKQGGKITHDVIATGFPVNHGKPGTALAPSGLAYDPRIDTLYFVDGRNNTLVAFKNVASIPRNGVKAIDNGMKFTGPSADRARIVYAGDPLNGPISTALLPNGNIVAGNTLDPNGKNLMVEISASGKLLDVLNVDKGTQGALFGIVATGSGTETKIYFNDDNDNNVQVLER